MVATCLMLSTWETDRPGDAFNISLDRIASYRPNTHSVTLKKKKKKKDHKVEGLSGKVPEDPTSKRCNSTSVTLAQGDGDCQRVTMHPWESCVYTRQPQTELQSQSISLALQLGSSVRRDGLRNLLGHRDSQPLGPRTGQLFLDIPKAWKSG